MVDAGLRAHGKSLKWSVLALLDSCVVINIIITVVVYVTFQSRSVCPGRYVCMYKICSSQLKMNSFRTGEPENSGFSRTQLGRQVSHRALQPQNGHLEYSHFKK